MVQIECHTNTDFSYLPNSVVEFLFGMEVSSETLEAYVLLS